MKAIIIVHNGITIENQLLAPIIRELILMTKATGEMSVSQLDDNEVKQSLMKTVAEKISVSKIVDDADEAIIKGIEFIKNKYSDLIPASKNNSIKHIEELKVKLTARIMADCYSTDREEAAMIRNCIIALSIVDPVKLFNLGLPKMIVETINLIRPMV